MPREFLKTTGQMDAGWPDALHTFNPSMGRQREKDHELRSAWASSEALSENISK